MIARPSRAACAHTRAYQSPPSLPNASLPSNLITFSAPLVSRKIRAIDCNGSSAANRRTLHYGSSCRDIAVTSPENRERRLFVSFCFVFSCVVFSFLSFVFSLPFLFLFLFFFFVLFRSDQQLRPALTFAARNHGVSGSSVIILHLRAFTFHFADDVERGKIIIFHYYFSILEAFNSSALCSFKYYTRIVESFRRDIIRV